MRRFGSGRLIAGSMAALGAAAVLAACAPPPGAGRATTAFEAAPRPGTADAADPCGAQVVPFVSAADLPGSPPARPGTLSAARLAAEIAAENAAIDRLRIAFDGLRYCRWTEVRTIREETRAGRLPRPQARDRLAQSNARFRRDIARAAEARARIAERSARLEAAAGTVAPGARAAAARAGDRGARAVASVAVPLRQQPDSAAREVGRFRAGQEATLTPAPDGFVLAESGPLRGYARGDAFAARAEAPAGNDLRTLLASNIAKREAFAESLALAERSAEASFEASL